MFFFEDLTNSIKKQFDNSDDLIVRHLLCGNPQKEICLIYFKSILDKPTFLHGVFTPLVEFQGDIKIETLLTSVLKIFEIEEIEKNQIITAVAENKVIMLIEGEAKCLKLDCISIPTRSPEEPPTSSVISGPREGFTESLRTNTALIRKRLPSEKLMIKQLIVGKLTKTKINIFYIDGLTDMKIVENVLNRIDSIDIDGIVDSHYIVNYLEEKPNSMFEQVGSCEKPDIAVARVLEGRVAISVDGSPIVLTLPYMVFEDIQNSNDYYTNSHYSSFIRVIRAIGLVLATIIPGVYLSFRLYHYRVLPMNFIVTISNYTQNLPFTPFVELVFILILFQILYEVSLRLPRYLGLATSIVGALILGDTGVKAGLISPPGVIVIALSIIAIYTVPNQAPQLTLLRALFLVIGATVGLLGIVGTIIYLINYLNTLTSYSAPYLAPYSPKVNNDLQDGVFMKNIKRMYRRPKSFKNDNERRGNP